MSIAGSNLTLNETDSRNITYIVDEGIPPSGPPTLSFEDMTFTNNDRVSISNSGVWIYNVSRSDAGTYRATWSNAGGTATFVLMLEVSCKLQIARCVL